jgi:tetratricopeptide (TPR) repeat protein
MKKPFISLCTALSLFAATAFANNSNGDSSSFYLQRAKEFRDARKVWEAEKSYQKALSFNPDDESAHLELASYYCEQHKYFPAIEQYKSVLAKNPNQSQSLQKMTEIYFLMRRWEDVISYANKMLANRLTCDKLTYMLAKSYFEEEDYGKAKNYLLEDVSKPGADKESIELLGKVYIELSNYDEAINVYQKCLKTSPDNTDLIYEMALLYSASHKDKEAVKYFEMAADKGYKQDLVFLENLGMAYLDVDVNKGVAVLNRVLEKKPGDVEVLTQIAQAYYRAENFPMAYDYFYKIYLSDNKNVKALYMSGIAMIRKGDKNKGSQICEQAINMDPQLASLRSTKSSF